MGGEASDSSGQPAWSRIGQPKVYTWEREDTEEEEEMAPLAIKTEQKGKLSINPMVEFSWKSKDYLAPAKETMSLVSKSAGMLEVTSGGFVPQASRVG